MCVRDLVSLSSDGTLNPNGVRFGSSEIYNIGMYFLFSSNYSQVIQEGRRVCPSRAPQSLLSKDAAFWHNSGPFAAAVRTCPSFQNYLIRPHCL